VEVNSRLIEVSARGLCRDIDGRVSFRPERVGLGTSENIDARG
jgi:hypothetical protein